jgi:ribosome maturation factor RimP
MHDMEKQVQLLLEPILRSLGLTLWDMEFRKQGPQWLLRIFIDRDPGGVTLNDCEAVSRDLGVVLDIEETVPHSYALEVSSPGLDRSLTRPEHYQKCLGQLVKIKTFQPIDKVKVFTGKLAGLEEGAAVLELDNGVLLRVPIDSISKASLVVVL